ncbi:MAG: TlpA disulfide reductase family protein [Actinomycetes bacterium]
MRGSALLLGAAVVLTGCAATSGTGSSDLHYVSGDGATTILSIKDRAAFPSVSGQTLTGTSLALSQFSGKVVVLNVWASWCPPCRAEAPTLERVAKALAAKGVVFIGIDTRDNLVAGQAYAANFGLTFQSLFDQDGALLLAFRGTLPPAAIPSTLVIDRHGRVAARALGGVDESRLLGLIDPVLQETS